MNRRQQHLLVVASGLAIGAIVIAANTLWAHPQPSGWFNYAPESGAVFSSPDRGSVLTQLALWLIGIGAWAALGWRIYRSSSTNDR